MSQTKDKKLAKCNSSRQASSFQKHVVEFQETHPIQYKLSGKLLVRRISNFSPGIHSPAKGYGAFSRVFRGSGRTTSKKRANLLEMKIIDNERMFFKVSLEYSSSCLLRCSISNF